jgi:hypothetical protein
MAPDSFSFFLILYTSRYSTDICRANSMEFSLNIMVGHVDAILLIPIYIMFIFGVMGMSKNFIRHLLVYHCGCMRKRRVQTRR